MQVMNSSTKYNEQVKELKRKYNQIKRAGESGNIFNVWDITGVEIPKINKMPTLGQYGINQGDVDQIPIEKKAWQEKSDKRDRILAIIVIIIGVISGPYFSYQFFSINDVHLEITIINILMFLLLSFFVGSFIGTIFNFSMAAVFAVVFKDKPPKSEAEKIYDQYLEDLRYYEYWQWKKEKDYWLSLTGEQFEHALAALYRDISFQAEVTRAGGDNGIDIIVNNEKESFIVQCKAHRSKIGPSAIRDFYGTMIHYGYEKGVFASLSGFTSGAIEFAQDKNIMLIDVNDIIINHII